MFGVSTWSMLFMHNQSVFNIRISWGSFQNKLRLLLMLYVVADMPSFLELINLSNLMTPSSTRSAYLVKVTPLSSSNARVLFGMEGIVHSWEGRIRRVLVMMKMTTEKKSSHEVLIFQPQHL